MRRVAPGVWIGHVGDLGDWVALHEAGIRAVVDLADNERPVALPRSLASLRFPLSDGGGNPAWLVVGAIAATARLVADRVPTLVACSAGLSRSPCVVAAALARAEGLDPDDTLARVTSAGPRDVAPGLWAEVRAALVVLGESSGAVKAR